VRRRSKAELTDNFMSMREEIFEQSTPWRGPLAVSAGFHICLVVAGMLLGWFADRAGNQWGMGGPMSEEHVVNAHMVATAIPLPARENDPNSVLATESVGQSEAQTKPPEPEPDAIPIQGRTTKTKPDKIHRPTIYQKLVAVPLASKEIVPFGSAPAASVPYSVFRSAAGNGGMTFGQNGSFAERYAWYVKIVQQKVSENWMKYEVDPGVQSAPRVYLMFEIARNGTPVNVELSQSSGIPSLDISAVRALKRIDTFGALPGDYSGNKVSVEFWFEFKR